MKNVPGEKEKRREERDGDNSAGDGESETKTTDTANVSLLEILVIFQIIFQLNNALA